MASCGARVLVVLLAGSAIALAVSGARGQSISATEQAAFMSGIRIDRSMLVAPLAPSPRSAMRLGSGGTLEPTEVNLIGSGVVLEMARVGPNGQFVRPRLLIGRQSPELMAWLRSAGIDPERCMLPTFRGRIKRDPESGKYGAAVLVSARCSFY